VAAGSVAAMVAAADVVAGCGVVWIYVAGDGGRTNVMKMPATPARSRIRPMIRISSR
jgi:hypothetical protein